MNNQTLINQLKRIKTAGPKKSWLKQTRQEIIYFAHTHIPIHQSRWPRVSFRLAAIIAVLILLLGSPVAIAQAETSRPGDLTYPLKRLIEKVRFRIARTPPAKRRLIRRQVQRRLHELSQSLETNNEKNQNIAVKETTETINDATTIKNGEAVSVINQTINSLDKLEDKITSEPKRQKLIRLKQTLIQIKSQQEFSATPSASPSSDTQTPVDKNLNPLQPDQVLPSATDSSQTTQSL